ncbi:MAG: hypothetical protein WKF73_20770 [Nocardioidaceae bacterium]
MLVPNLAEHKTNVEKLINFYYDPVNAAKLAAWNYYFCPVQGAEERDRPVRQVGSRQPLDLPRRGVAVKTATPSWG